MNIQDFYKFIEDNKVIDFTMDYKEFPRKQFMDCDCINNYNGFEGVADLFDRMHTSLGRIPTQEEYCLEYLELAKLKFNGSSFYYKKIDSYISIQYTPEIERIILWRATRAYLSYILEIQAELIIRERLPQFGIYKTKELDTAGAVDIMLMNKITHNLELIHIAKNGDGIPKKMGESRVCLDGKWVEFDRGNFDGHRLVYYYDATDEKVSSLKNGFILFNEDYIIKEITKPHKDTYELMLKGTTAGVMKDKYLYDFCKLLEEHIGSYTFKDYSEGTSLSFSNIQYIELYENRLKNL